jgi:hypothetical protein
MTAIMPAPERDGRAAGRAGFTRVLHAEWVKFRTVRSWVIGMMAAAVLMDLVGLFAGGNSNISCGKAARPRRARPARHRSRPGRAGKP